MVCPISLNNRNCVEFVLLTMFSDSKYRNGDSPNNMPQTTREKFGHKNEKHLKNNLYKCVIKHNI